MKVYKTARGILNASIKDIKDGRWCKKDLLQIREDGGNAYDSCTNVKDPMGCALGLISMHGGLGYEYKEWIELANEVESEYTLFVGEYANNDSPEMIKEALEALYAAIPSGAQAKRKANRKLKAHSYWDRYTEVINEAIYSYNDKRDMDEVKALAWFEAALEEL